MRQTFSSGSAWEPVVGYSRAVRVGSAVFVAGTTAGGADGPVGGDDPAEQAREVLQRIAAALAQAGAELTDVVRTRIYLTRMSDFEAVGGVHGDVFSAVRPATTVVEVAALADPRLLVEIDVDAILASAGG